MGAEQHTPALALGSTLLGAAIGLVPSPQAVAEVVPERGSISFRYLFHFALKTITALPRLAVLQHCLRLRALFSFLMQIGM